MIVNSNSWPVDNQEVRMKKGKLIRVEVSPGRIVKMYEADAVAQGLIEPSKEKAAPTTKQKPKPQDKQQLPGETKEPEQPAPADDFTVIDGVGPATARALAANGITTLDELASAGELDYLTATVNAAIQTWRDSSG
jgi:predicted flap endonuclease-1-like 5' DNA nuclease